MTIPSFRPFPQTFYLRNLAEVTSRACALKVNPHSEQADIRMRSWFLGFKVYNPARAAEFMDRGRFDIFAALSFPDADMKHLETCLAFFFWAFSTDDLSDEGEFQAKPDRVKSSIDICRKVLYNKDLPEPEYPYAAMLHDLFKRIQTTATRGTCDRFIRAYEDFSNSQIKQSLNRSLDRMPSVSEFIAARRATIGAALVEAMVEYSLDLDIPDYVFEHPILMAMSNATTDMMTWPNDICSFNKEQADGDFQNLVCCIMVERRVELQEAVDILVEMLDARVTDYINLKAQLPSFGAAVDDAIAKYHTALENFVQGTVVWYYKSPRYFSRCDRREGLDCESLTIKTKRPSTLPMVSEEEMSHRAYHPTTKRYGRYIIHILVFLFSLCTTIIFFPMTPTFNLLSHLDY